MSRVDIISSFKSWQNMSWLMLWFGYDGWFDFFVNRACRGSPFRSLEASASQNPDLFTNPVLIINIRRNRKGNYSLVSSYVVLSSIFNALINLTASQDLCHSTIDKSTPQSRIPWGTTNSLRLRHRHLWVFSIRDNLIAEISSVSMHMYQWMVEVGDSPIVAAY